MATSFTTHSAGQVIASADINLIQTAVNTLENAGGSLQRGTYPAFLSQSVGAADTGAQAFKGVLFTPTGNTTIRSVLTGLSATTSAATYVAKVLTLTSNAIGTTTVATVVGTSDVITVNQTIGSGNNAWMEAHFSTPAVLTAGTTYAFMFGATSQGNTFALPINYSWDFTNSYTTDLVPGSLGAALTVSVALQAPIATSTAVVAATTAGKRLQIGFVATF